MTDENLVPSQDIYQIRVRSNLNPNWEDWFDGFTITYRANNETCLVGTVADQAALHGIFAKIRDLGLSLLSVNRIAKTLAPPGNEHDVES
jgi:hypothetical protein